MLRIPQFLAELADIMFNPAARMRDDDEPVKVPLVEGYRARTAPPTTARPPASTTPGSCCRCSGCPRAAAARHRPRAASSPPTPRSRCRSPCCGRWPTGRGWRPGVPGGTTPVRLIDDDLATSLAPGGRLDTLLSAAEFATSPPVDPDGAVDARAVSGRRPGPAGHGQRDDGRLRRVRLARRALGTADPPRHRPGRGIGVAGPAARAGPAGCACAAAPYAQADLDALQRVGDPGLSAIATNGAGDIVDQILGVPSDRGAPPWSATAR